MIWSFLIPLETPSQNQLQEWHWRKRHKRGKAFEFWARAHGHGIPAATGHRFVKLMSYRKQRCKDIANLIGGSKGILDSLVRCGLLLDDSIPLMTATYDQATCLHSPIPGKVATIVTLSDVSFT